MRTKSIAIFLSVILLAACAPAITPAPTTAPASAFTPSPAGTPAAVFGATATYEALAFPSATPTWTFGENIDPSLYVLTPYASPTAIPTATPGIRTPACTFPLAQTTREDSKPEEYTFSEPKVVKIAAKGVIYNIAEWLPDNQQVLMTEELRNVKVDNNSILQENISLYNPETGISKLYATRSLTGPLPSWQPKLSAVIYPVMNYFDVDRKNQTYKLIRQIWVSYGKPGTARILADNLPQLYIAFKPDSGEILYLADDKIFKLDNILKNLPPVDFDPTQWNYATPYKDDVYVQHEMAWQPNTSLIFLFSHDYWGRGGYTFILNADTGQVCELDFGGWATEAHWSSNGRYLAIGRATKFHPTDLALLDTITGKLTTLNNAPKNEYGQRYLNGFTWAPDNRHLVAIGGVLAPKIGQDNHNVQGLFLIDIDSVQSKMITFAENFYTNSPQSMIWSPNGSKLVFRCPTKEVDRLCFISVRKTEP